MPDMAAAAPTAGNILEDLVDCLERDLLSEQEKSKSAKQELERLREHLLKVDQELNEESAKRDQLVERFKERTAELQHEAQFWRQKCDELQEEMSTEEGASDEDEILAQIERATEELKEAQSKMEYERQRSADLLSGVNERDKDICDLQAALQALEQEKQRDIEIGLAESRERLQCAQRSLHQMTSELEDMRAEAKAVPDLKRKIAELDVEVDRLRTEMSTATCTSDSVNKALVSNLLINLFDRTRPVDRRQVAVMLCDLLDIAGEDRERMGVLAVDGGGSLKEAPKEASVFSFADQWIAYLSKESSGGN